MTTIVEIPGVGEVEFPDSMSRDQIKTASQKLVQKNRQEQQVVQERAIQQEPGILETMGRAGVEQFLDNILNLPNLVNQVVNAMNPLTQARSIAGTVAEGVDQFQQGDLDVGRLAEAGQIPQPQRIDVPTGSDVFGMAQVAGENAANLTQTLRGQENLPPVASVGEASQQQRQISRQQREQRPASAGTGRLLGSAASLLAGRAPLARAARDARLSGQVTSGAGAQLAPGTRKLFSDILSSPGVQKLSKGLGRAGETGIEGATLSILEGGDPLEVAAFSTGGQMAGSLALTLFPSTRKGLVNFAATTAGLAALARLGQGFGPGQNNIFEAIDTAFDKTKYALLSGALAGIAGAGRIRSGSFADNLPVAAEAITAIPRGAALSFLNDVVSEQERGENTTMAVMDRLSTDPDYFGPNVRKRIESAMMSGKRSVSKEIQQLMKNNKKFRQKFEELE